jgi:hypothetical protein
MLERLDVIVAAVTITAGAWVLWRILLSHRREAPAPVRRDRQPVGLIMLGCVLSALNALLHTNGTTLGRVLLWSSAVIMWWGVIRTVRVQRRAGAP